MRQWPTAVGDGPFGPSEGPAGHLHDPLHPGGDRGLDRRRLVQILIGTVRCQEQQPLGSVERRASVCGRVSRRHHRQRHIASARVAHDRARIGAALGEVSGDVPPDRARRAEQRDHTATASREAIAALRWPSPTSRRAAAAAARPPPRRTRRRTGRAQEREVERVAAEARRRPGRRAQVSPAARRRTGFGGHSAPSRPKPVVEADAVDHGLREQRPDLRFGGNGWGRFANAPAAAVGSGFARDWSSATRRCSSPPIAESRSRASPGRRVCTAAPQRIAKFCIFVTCRHRSTW